ncbi:MAG: hypothetical protein B6245_24280 [Desulfobacteraceae bacterium 4572_88]|nr:MAG: hypothetical protein B6245_24280 [Desulfobacteraceae bacterium 4572_88]
MFSSAEKPRLPDPFLQCVNHVGHISSVSGFKFQVLRACLKIQSPDMLTTKYTEHTKYSRDLNILSCLSWFEKTVNPFFLRL